MEEIELKVDVNKELAERLNTREEIVLRMRLGIGTGEHTLKEVGNMVGVGPSRIHDIEGNAFRKLKKSRKMASFLKRL